MKQRERYLRTAKKVLVQGSRAVYDLETRDFISFLELFESIHYPAELAPKEDTCLALCFMSAVVARRAN